MADDFVQVIFRKDSGLGHPRAKAVLWVVPHASAELYILILVVVEELWKVVGGRTHRLVFQMLLEIVVVVTHLRDPGIRTRSLEELGWAEGCDR